MAYYIGTMSGTSVDGVDVAIVEFEGNRPCIKFANCVPFAEELRDNILKAIQSPNTIGLEPLGTLNAALGHAYANAINSTLDQAGINSEDIVAIGNHGQTLYHQPNSELPFSMQLGDASIIAERCNITTVCDFRSRDLAAGGQGAPLVPAFHQSCFQHNTSSRAIVNIGGIANITYLATDGSLLGFDTGPGNTLLDLVCQTYLEEDHDTNGNHAAQGVVNRSLLAELQSHSYFEQAPPKSTGRELFNLDLLTHFFNEQQEVHTQDVLATLTELTAWSITKGIKEYCPNTNEIYICGGGVHNAFLMERLETNLDKPVYSTSELGMNPDWVEACAFAWLAKQTLDNTPNNSPLVTGAKGERILGAIYPK